MEGDDGFNRVRFKYLTSASFTKTHDPASTLLGNLPDLGFPVIKMGMTTMGSWLDSSLRYTTLIRGWEISEMLG